MRVATSAALAALVFVAPATPITTAASSTGRPVRSRLYQTSRARLALALARGESYFPVVIASARGKNARVAAVIRAVGGYVDYEADDADYLRARVPLMSVEQVASIDGVDAISADAPVTVLYQPPPKDITSSLRQGGDAPLTHPYLASKDIRTVELRAQHPTFDGRGVTIAVLDSVPDFLLPELQYAKALDGTRIPKFADIRSTEDPNAVDAVSSPWLPVNQRVHAEDGRFTISKTTYYAPHDGDFYFVQIPNNGFYKYVYDVVNGREIPFQHPMDVNQTAAASKSLFAALWDVASNTVWLDTKRSRDFRSETGLTDYAVHHDFAVVPVRTDDPALRPSAGVVVQTDRTDHKLAFLFGMGSHPTGSVASAAANHDGGGRIDGIAPGAQVVVMREDYSALHDTIDAVVWAMRNRKVDVICLESISPLSYAPKDGRDVEAIVFDRLVKKYDKPILQPGGNDPGMGRISEGGVPNSVFDVAMYISGDAFRVNQGIDTLHKDNSFGSYGPPGNGALKPDFIAPSMWISLAPAFTKIADATRKGVYSLPPGYTIFGGTSQATPTAAGAIAVLISAARQTGVPVSVARLMAATKRTAHFTSLPAYVQGAGLLQIDAAWKALAMWRNKPLPSVTFNAPVRTVTSQSLNPPNRGEGLFEREGWTAGESGKRFISISRSNSVPQTVTVELRGNDGTFSAKPTFTFSKQNARLEITIAARRNGAHSALLVLSTPDTHEVVGQALMTIVVADRFTASNHYAVERRIEVPRPGDSASVFVKVPSGAKALIVRTTSPVPKIGFWPFNPDSTDPNNVSNNLLTSVQLVKGVTQTVFPHPQPGTWELQLTDRTDLTAYTKAISHPARSRSLKMIATLINVRGSSSGNRVVAESLAGDVPTLMFSRATAATASYGGRVSPGQQKVFNIDVPDDATGVGAWLTSEPGSSVNLYLFECKTICIIRQKSTMLAPSQYIYFDRPRESRWKLVVDGYMTAKSGTPYRLTDYFVEGAPFGAHRTKENPRKVALFGVLGNDFYYYYNEMGPELGPHLPRPGLNPIIFDVQLLQNPRR